MFTESSRVLTHSHVSPENFTCRAWAAHSSGRKLYDAWRLPETWTPFASTVLLGFRKGKEWVLKCFFLDSRVLFVLVFFSFAFFGTDAVRRV